LLTVVQHSKTSSLQFRFEFVAGEAMPEMAELEVVAALQRFLAAAKKNAEDCAGRYVIAL
jgi:hypothetical protein